MPLIPEAGTFPNPHPLYSCWYKGESSEALSHKTAEYHDPESSAYGFFCLLKPAPENFPSVWRPLPPDIPIVPCRLHTSSLLPENHRYPDRQKPEYRLCLHGRYPQKLQKEETLSPLFRNGLPAPVQKSRRKTPPQVCVPPSDGKTGPGWHGLNSAASAPALWQRCFCGTAHSVPDTHEPALSKACKEVCPLLQMHKYCDERSAVFRKRHWLRCRLPVQRRSDPEVHKTALCPA